MRVSLVETPPILGSTGVGKYVRTPSVLLVVPTIFIALLVGLTADFFRGITCMAC